MYTRSKQKPDNLKRAVMITAGIFTCCIGAANLSPIKALACEEIVQDKIEISEAQAAVMETIPEIETEKDIYWKDGKEHDVLTDKSKKELAIWIADLKIDGKDMFPDIRPELLEAQWQYESRCFVDATNGNSIDEGYCVGISQSSCYWNVANVQKWCYVVGEDPNNVVSKEDARRILLEYPQVNGLVQAQQLQDYIDRCPSSYMSNAEKYALTIFRWGNMEDGQVEYNGTNNYSDSIQQMANNKTAEYETFIQEQEAANRFQYSFVASGIDKSDMKVGCFTTVKDKLDRQLGVAKIEIDEIDDERGIG